MVLWGLFGGVSGYFGGEFIPDYVSIPDSIVSEINPGSFSLGFQSFSEVVLPVSVSDSHSLRKRGEREGYTESKERDFYFCQVLTVGVLLNLFV